MDHSYRHWLFVPSTIHTMKELYRCSIICVNSVIIIKHCIKATQQKWKTLQLGKASIVLECWIVCAVETSVVFYLFFNHSLFIIDASHWFSCCTNIVILPFVTFINNATYAVKAAYSTQVLTRYCNFHLTFTLVVWTYVLRTCIVYSFMNNELVMKSSDHISDTHTSTVVAYVPAIMVQIVHGMKHPWYEQSTVRNIQGTNTFLMP